MEDYLFILVAYLSGSVPYGLIFSKFFGGIDIRHIGSGNIGTTNVLRTGHKGIAASTLVCDALKGFLPVYIASHMGVEKFLLLVVAYVAMLGHVFPVWLKFQGGKGVATGLGALCALSPALGIFATFIWGLTGRISNISSLSALCSFGLCPLFAALVLSTPLALFSFAVALLIFWTHRANIQRLIQGEEKGMGEIEA